MVLIPNSSQRLSNCFFKSESKLIRIVQNDRCFIKKFTGFQERIHGVLPASCKTGYCRFSKGELHCRAR